MALFKEIKNLKQQINYWESYEPVNWLGKWSRSVRLQSLKARYLLIEKKIQILKNKK
jgi:hypothetical protein